MHVQLGKNTTFQKFTYILFQSIMSIRQLFIDCALTAKGNHHQRMLYQWGQYISPRAARKSGKKKSEWPSVAEIRGLFPQFKRQFPKGQARIIITYLYQQITMTEDGEDKLKALFEKKDILDRIDSLLQSNPSEINEFAKIQRNIALAFTILYQTPTGHPFICHKNMNEGAIALDTIIFVNFYAASKEASCIFLPLYSQRSKYIILARSVIIQTYRRIQKYLEGICRITPISNDQLVLGFEVMHNCQKTMQEEDSQTFLKVLKGTFQLEFISIPQVSLVKVYIIILNQIKKRLQYREGKQKDMDEPSTQETQQPTTNSIQPKQPRSTMRSKPLKRFYVEHQGKQMSSVVELNKIWNAGMDKELIDFFKRNNTFTKVKEYFKQRFPRYSHLFTGGALKGQFHKIIRVALRKLRVCLDAMDNKAPFLVHLHDKRIKFLMVAQSNEINNQLMRMYTEDFTEEQLHKTVNAINAYVAKRQSQITDQYGQLQSSKNEYDDIVEASSDEIQVKTYQSDFKEINYILSDHGYKSITSKRNKNNEQQTNFSQKCKQKVKQFLHSPSP